MPLVHRKVGPVKLSGGKLNVDKYDTEFTASNNATMANLLRQLASLVQLAGDIFTEVGDLTTQVGNRIHFVKLKLDEIDSKADLFDPKLVPVPEGSLDDPPISHKFRDVVLLNNMKYFTKKSRPKFLTQMYELAGSHEPSIPPRSPILGKHLFSERVEQSRRPASFAALRDWKLDDYLDEKIGATLGAKQPKSSLEAVNRAVAKSFPSQLVQVDVTGRGFDRMKSNRRSLVIHTKRIRIKKRRNTICGSMPNKECGIQTSFTSVAGGSADGHKKYGIDSGHWSSCTTSSAPVGPTSSSAPSPWDPNSLSTSPSDFLFEEEEPLNSQLQNLTDGLVSDSDSVDTEGYFTSFRNECGFPKAKALFVKSSSTSTGGDVGETVVNGNDEASSSTFSSLNANNSGDSEYELFGKGSTSSCGTVVMMRNKPEPPVRNNSSSTENIDAEKKDDKEWEERVKRKSLIERVPSLVVITPSPSSPCSSVSPTFKNPRKNLKDQQFEDSSDDKGTLTNGSESDTDSGELTEDISSAITSRPRLERPCSSNSNESSVSTLTLTEKSVEHNSSVSLEKQGIFSDSRKLDCKDEKATRFSIPDVIPDAQILIRTGGTPKKLDLQREYLSLDTVPCRSFKEEQHESNNSNSENESKKSSSSATSGRIRGARVVLDANGQIIFSSETLRRKKKHKVSFDPGNAVKEQLYDSNSNYARIRESVYDRIKKDGGENKEKLYETIEEIRRHNLKPSEKILSFEEERKCLISPPLPPNNNNNYLHSIVNGRLADNKSPSSMSNCSGRSRSSNNSNSPGHHPTVNVLLETDLDSAIPPEMPELKNLPKIKDRLKRNESYRIATDEIPPLAINKNNSLSALTNKKRLQLNSVTSSPTSSIKDRDNRKRDIPEENPAFIQQILSLRNKAQSPSPNGHSHKMTNLNNKSSTLDSTSAKFRLSKFAWSPLEDRPSFLRRDSSPTMDDIAKEIYRFRKKFNINPSPSTNSTARKTLTSSASFSVSPLRNAFNRAFPTNYLKGNSTPSISQTTDHSTTIPNGHVKKPYDSLAPLNSKGSKDKIQSNGPPPPPRRHFPPSYQNPPRSIYPNSNPTMTGESIYRNSHKNTLPIPNPTEAKQASQLDQNGHLPNSGSFRRNFLGNKIFPVSYSFSGNSNQNQNNFNSNSNPIPITNEVLLRGGWLSTNRMRNSISESTNLSARYKDRVLQQQNGSISTLPNSQTSLGDFKKLLQATQRSSMKRNSISAVEILKPKFSQQETTL